MRKDGTLTKAEKSTMLKAFHIMQQWVQAHRLDDCDVDEIAECVHLLNGHMHAMLDDDSGRL